MNRTFRQGLLSAVVGLVIGAAYQAYAVRTGSCAGYFAAVGGGDACAAVKDGTAGLNVFAMATLALTVVTGLVAARRYAEEEGFLSLGDTFLAIGTMVVLVEAVFFAASGLWMGLAYGVAGLALTLFALKQGNCVGYVYDQTFLQGKLLDADWSTDYAMPLPGILDTPWIMAVKPGETAFKEFLEGVTKDWMKTGAIIALEKKWGITPTEYSTKMHDKYKSGTN